MILSHSLSCLFGKPVNLVEPKYQIYEPDLPQKHTRKVQLGIYHTNLRPSSHGIVAILDE